MSVPLEDAPRNFVILMFPLMILRIVVCFVFVIYLKLPQPVLLLVLHYSGLV